MQRLEMEEISTDRGGARGSFPFKLRRQARVGPCGIGGGLKEAHMRNRVFAVQCLNTAQSEYGVVVLPIERCSPTFALRHRPAVGQPEFGAPIAAIFDE